MSIPTVAQRLSGYSLNTLKRANAENLQKINTSFGKITARDEFQNLQAQFDVVIPRFGKKERIQLTSDSVEGQKHPSIKAIYARGREKIEPYADQAFEQGYGFGNMLSAEWRSPHLSPKFILKSGNRVTKKTLDRYRKVLTTFRSEQNTAALETLAERGIHAKVLKNGQFRIRKTAANGKSSTLLKLSKRHKQSYEEFVNDGVQYAQLLAEPLPYVSPKLALKNNRRQNIVARDGFAKYEKVKNLLTTHQNDYNRLGTVQNAAFKVKGTGQLKITDAQKRTYVVNPNKSTNFDQFFENGLAFANNAARKSENISTGLMVKNHRKIDLSGIKDFDAASAFFTDNQTVLNDLKNKGVLVKLRHNGTLRITRKDSWHQVFKKKLTREKNQTIQQFLEVGLNHAKLVAEADLPPSIFSRTFSIVSRTFSIVSRPFSIVSRLFSR